MKKLKKKIVIPAAVLLAVVITAAVIIYPRYRNIFYMQDGYNEFDSEFGQIEWNGKIYNRLHPLNDFKDKIYDFVYSMMNASMFAFNDYRSGEQIGILNDNKNWQIFELAGEHEEDFIVATDGILIYKWLYILDRGLPTLEDTEKIEIGMSLEEVYIIMGSNNQGIGSISGVGSLYGWEISDLEMFWVTYGRGEVVNTDIRDINR